MRAEVVVPCEIKPRHPFRPSMPSRGIIEKEICNVVFVSCWVCVRKVVHPSIQMTKKLRLYNAFCHLKMTHRSAQESSFSQSALVCSLRLWVLSNIILSHPVVSFTFSPMSSSSLLVLILFEIVQATAG